MATIVGEGPGDSDRALRSGHARGARVSSPPCRPRSRLSTSSGDKAYVFRRLVNRALFRRRLHGDVVERFTEVYYEGALLVRPALTRAGSASAPTCPLDLWICQELLHELRPDLIVETGTAFGGSALYFASLLELLDTGRVLTIDLQPQEDRPEHPRIEYLNGSSVAP